MLPFILLAALAATQQISMECANAADAGVQTQPVHGPAGSSAILKVSSSDDASKDSHQCNADYQLMVTPAAGATPTTVDFLSSDGDYGRSLSLRLDGFSQDGGRIFGVLVEGDSTPMTLLFDYRPSGGPVKLVDLAKQFAPVMPAACIRTLDVIGTTSSGAFVLETNSAKRCASLSRWMLDPTAGRPRLLPPSARFSPSTPRLPPPARTEPWSDRESNQSCAAAQTHKYAQENQKLDKNVLDGADFVRDVSTLKYPFT